MNALKHTTMLSFRAQRGICFLARQFQAPSRFLAALGMTIVVGGVMGGLLSLRAAENAGAPAPGFTDITKAAGITSKHTNRAFANEYANIMQGYTALGAAAAVADFDSDGFEDLFVTDSKLGGKNHLYKNEFSRSGTLKFVDVAESSGVADGNDQSNVTADALWFDYNNDSRPDLYVVRFGQSLLYENLGNGKFKDVTKASGLTGYHNAITAIAFDYDRDGDLDLFVGSYFKPVNIFQPDTPRFFPESFETAANGGGLALYRNNGDKTFSEVSAAAGIKLSGWTLDLGHGDADNDGDDDLYVAADFGTDSFFVNNGDGTFKNTTEKSIGVDTKKGMNAEWGDYDNDGLLDIYVTNITDDYMREGNFLWHNNGLTAGAGDITFTDVARETGTYDTGWGWGGKFFDYDNDGWLDLYVVNGWVSAGKESYVPDIFEMVVKPGIDFADLRNWPPMGVKSLSGYQRKKLFHNQRGEMFKDEAARYGVDSLRDGRGIAVADFDNDGRLDMFVANANTEPYLYRNTMPQAGNWAEFILQGTKSNDAGVGAQLRLTVGDHTYLRFVNGGNGFASQSSTRLHIGLGGASKIDSLEVRWPSGEKQTFKSVPAGRIQHIVEGAAMLQPFTPRVGK
jgi:hypothetical protein